MTSLNLYAHTETKSSLNSHSLPFVSTLPLALTPPPVSQFLALHTYPFLQSSNDLPYRLEHVQTITTHHYLPIISAIKIT